MRVMGIETEYGILGGDGVRQNPMALSALVVAAYDQVLAARGSTCRARWSYEGEDPLSDARGWRLDRAVAHPSQLTDAPVGPPAEGHPAPPPHFPPHRAADPGPPARFALEHRPRPRTPREEPVAANLLVPNGARLYVDHAHPEYSSPEVTSAKEAVRWDRAGEEIMLAAVRTLAANPHTPEVRLYKNNVDGKGASYGTHENYLVQRTAPFEDIVRYLTPFLVTRQILVGAGRVGLGPTGTEPGFQLSQRADYIEAEVGLETTLRRPIINTRDEPHADPDRYRRLHVIIGDANCFDVATYLKLGATSLVLAVLEQAASTGAVPTDWDNLALADPVRAVQTVSRDLTLTQPLELADGGQATAAEIQRRYLEGVRTLLADRLDADPEEAEVLATWDRLLSLLLTDRAAAAREVEWLAKFSVLEGLRARHHLGWDHAKLAAADLQWSDIRPERGLAARLRAAGALAEVSSQEEVRDAVAHPPRSTRAFFRGESVRRFPGEVMAAGWNGVLFDVPARERQVRVALPDPLWGGAAEVEALFDASPDAEALLSALERLAPSGATIADPSA